MALAVRRLLRIFGVAAMLAVLSACTMSLVPQYQQSLVDGINQANTKALTLFATLSRGSPKAEFPKLKPRYDEVIGAFDALRLAASSRAVPALAGQLFGGSLLKKVCTEAGKDTNDCVNATPLFLAEVVSIVTDIRDDHADAGLGADEVAYYKPLYDQEIRFALTVENALKR